MDRKIETSIMNSILCHLSSTIIFCQSSFIHLSQTFFLLLIYFAANPRYYFIYQYISHLELKSIISIPLSLLTKLITTPSYHFVLVFIQIFMIVFKKTFFSWFFKLQLPFFWGGACFYFILLF